MTVLGAGLMLSSPMRPGGDPDRIERLLKVSL
jgi:hypothetical protein